MHFKIFDYLRYLKCSSSHMVLMAWTLAKNNERYLKTTMAFFSAFKKSSENCNSVYFWIDWKWNGWKLKECNLNINAADVVEIINSRDTDLTIKKLVKFKIKSTKLTKGLNHIEAEMMVLENI